MFPDPTPDLATASAIVGGLPDLAQLSPTHLLDEAQAAAYLDLRPNTLSIWRCTGRYPLRFRKIGRKVRYAAGDLLAFLEARTFQHTGEH